MQAILLSALLLSGPGGLNVDELSLPVVRQLKSCSGFRWICESGEKRTVWLTQKAEKIDAVVHVVGRNNAGDAEVADVSDTEVYLATDEGRCRVILKDLPKCDTEPLWVRLSKRAEDAASP